MLTRGAEAGSPDSAPPLFAVVLAGGPGNRLWPRTRLGRPKQLLVFDGPQTPLQAAVARLTDLVRPGHTIILTNRLYTAEVTAQLPGVSTGSVLILEEPAARDTGPAVALAALYVAARWKRRDAVLLVVPSDHRVRDQAGYLATLTAAVAAARFGYLVAVGVRPTRAETAYGYIQPGDILFRAGDRPVLAVRRFVEKPDRRRAAAYLRSGRYLWNAGIFAWQAGAILEALDRHAGEARDALRQLAQDAPGRAAELFMKLPAVSVDRWVLEREKGIVVVPAGFDWEDLGSWTALRRTRTPDDAGNVVLGRAVAVGARDCVIDAGDRTVVAVGVKDLIIVDAGDVVLVCDGRCDQHVGALRDRLRQVGLDCLL